MKISVIIPAYKAEEWVAQCMENLFSQSHKDLEIIFVYDESGDRTGEIVEEYAAKAAPHPSVKSVRLENAGVSVARNTGIEMATGDYLHFYDVDDLLNADFYARMADAVEVTGADVACCSVINEYDSGGTHLWDERWVLTTPCDKFSALNIYDHGYSWRYLFRRDFVNARGLRFEPGMPMMEDMPFSQYSVLWANKVVTVPGAVYYYKRRDNSALNNRDKAHVKQRQALWRKAALARQKFMIDNRLEGTLANIEVWQYKIFGLPLLLKKHIEGERNFYWYFLGLRVLSYKKLRGKPKKVLNR